jgi:hypothetical protein
MNHPKMIDFREQQSAGCSQRRHKPLFDKGKASPMLSASAMPGRYLEPFKNGMFFKKRVCFFFNPLAGNFLVRARTRRSDFKTCPPQRTGNRIIHDGACDLNPITSMFGRSSQNVDSGVLMVVP